MCEGEKLGALGILDRSDPSAILAKPSILTDTFGFRAARIRLHPIRRDSRVDLCLVQRAFPELTLAFSSVRLRIFEKISRKKSRSLRSMENMTVTQASFVECLNYNFAYVDYNFIAAHRLRRTKGNGFQGSWLAFRKNVSII